MKRFILTFLLMPILFLSNGYPQGYTTWGLPEGAQRRIGKGGIRFLKFSPDGNRLAVANEVGIWMYDAYTGAELSLFKGHTEEIHHVAFSLERQVLASTANDMTIRLWHTETGEQLDILPMGSTFFRPVVFSPGGTLLAAGGRNGDIQIWDVGTGTPFITLKGHTAGVQTLVFSPNGKILASGGEDTSIRLWDVATGEHLSTLTGHRKPVELLVFSPDGTILASSDRGRTIRLWDAEGRKQLRSLVQPGLTNANTQSPTALAFSPDGTILASGSSKGTIQIWNVDEGSLIASTEAHTERVIALTFSRNRTLISADWEGTVQVLDPLTGDPLSNFTLNGHKPWGLALGFSGDGATLMSGGWGGSGNAIQFWDLNTGKPFTPIRLSEFVSFVQAFSLDGKTLASTGSGTQEHLIWVWDLPEGRERTILAGHTGSVDALAFSPDGGCLLVAERIQRFASGIQTLENVRRRSKDMKWR